MSVSRVDRLLFISGQVPQDGAGAVPKEPEALCRLIWEHIRACLAAAGLGLGDLVHVRTYLSDRSLAAVNSTVRREVLGR